MKKPKNVDLKKCPCCNGNAILKMEGWHYSKYHNLEGKHKSRFYKGKRQYSRVLCENTLKPNYKDRCGLKTVAMPHPMAVESWNRRDK